MSSSAVDSAALGILSAIVFVIVGAVISLIKKAAKKTGIEEESQDK